MVVSVSVVIPCYSCVDTIKRAVKSVARQTLKPYEVILVEDCSGDITLEVLYKVQAQYDQGWVKVIPLSQNSGPGTARNIGWDASEQDYIAFLDADDSWHPQKIEIQYGWMIGNPAVVLTGHDCMQIKDEKKNSATQDYCSSDLKFYSVSKAKLLLSNRFPTRSVMVKRDIFQRFPIGKRYSEDYHLWLEIAYAGLVCYRIDLPLAYLYKANYGEAGLSANLWRMEKGELEIYQNLHKKNLINTFQYMFFLMFSLMKFLKRIIV